MSVVQDVAGDPPCRCHGSAVVDTSGVDPAVYTATVLGMLDLKAKLLAAGVVTAEQVKKVEDEQVARQARDSERRDADRRRREEGPPPRQGGDRGGRADGPRGERGRVDGPRGDRGGPADRGAADRGAADRGGPRGPRPDRSGPRGPRDGVAAAKTESDAAPASAAALRPRDTRSFKERRADEGLEKRARREHEWDEAKRWRGRTEALLAAGKSEQFQATRGWVMKERLDNKAITDAAERFFFTTWLGALSHLTVEPDVRAMLSEGSAGIVAFMGYNGLEHAVVPKDVAIDVRAIKPEWMRHLIGITDIEPALVKAPTPEGDAEAGAEGEAASVIEVGPGDDVDAAAVGVLHSVPVPLDGAVNGETDAAAGNDEAGCGTASDGADA